MDRKVLSELLQIPLELLDRDPSQLSPTEARQAKMLRSYVEDGGRARENEDPENVWYRIEFLKDYTDVVDSKDTRMASEGGYFDTSGRAVDPRLRRSEGKDAETAGQVTFQKGQQILFIKSVADQLIANGPPS